MLLQKLVLDVNVTNLCSQFLVLIVIWSLPIMVQFSRCSDLISQFDCRSQESYELSLKLYERCVEGFLIIKVSGTVLVFSMELNRMCSRMSKSAIAGRITVRSRSSSTGFFHSSLKCCNRSSVYLAGLPKRHVEIGTPCSNSPL